MIVQQQVGPVSTTSSIGANTQAPFRAGNMGETIISALHGRYYESTYRRTMFTVASTAAVATVALGTTASYTGLYVQNPIGSTVNGVINKATWASSVAVPTAGFVGIEAGYNSGSNITYGGAIVPLNNFVGVGASGVLVAGAGSATLPTAPTAKYFLSITGSQATSGFNMATAGVIDMEGGLILPPGAYACFFTFATNTAAWWFSMTWSEVAA